MITNSSKMIDIAGKMKLQPRKAPNGSMILNKKNTQNSENKS
jgi:hypothetical protein